MPKIWNRPRLRRYEGTLSVLLRLADALVCVGAGLAAFVVRFGFRGIPDAYQVALAVVTLLVLLLFPMLRVYAAFRTSRIALPAARAAIAWVLVIGLFMVLSVLVGRGERFSRIWIMYWFVFGVVAFAALRCAAYAWLRFLRRTGRNLKNVALVGNGSLADELLRRTEQDKWMGYSIVARYSSLGNPETSGPCSTAAEELRERCARRELDEIWIVPTMKQAELVGTVCALARSWPVTVRYVPDFRELFLLNHGITEMAGLPMIDLTSSPLQGVNGLLKRCEDLAFGFVILILSLPVMAVIALGVRLSSPGPVLFKQRRHGWGGEVIKVYKFRTMRMHAENDTVTQARKDDERITRFGRFLRRTSLDELPQIVNVLQGRMSLVGPRPHACQHNDLYRAQIEGYMLRHKMRPGITGWAQVNGLRGETDTLDKMEDRVKHDLYYIEHWSLWLDVKILFLTLFSGFVNPNAY